MKSTTTTAMLAMAAAGICMAAEPPRKVTVCMSVIPGLTVPLARAYAGKMFARAGVQIVWRNSQYCPKGAPTIHLTTGAPDKENPGALAYALPYQGTGIVIYWDRVLNYDSRLVTALLAHVLVHELTHLLLATDHHSSTGVMKARWESEDFQQMSLKPLPFTNEDVRMIHLGLDARETRSIRDTLVATK